MTLDEIRELVQLVIETGVAELEVARGENRVRIRRTVKQNRHEVRLAEHAALALAADNASSSAPEKPAPTAQDEGVVYVRSPIVGTFYEAPSPDASPFVRVGERVQPGQVLCIIESMKLMNEIEAEMAGTVVSKLVENSHPVEYGEALFGLRPD